VFDLWLQCYSQREIAEKLGITQPTVKEVIDKVIENGNIAKNKHPHDFTLKRPIRGIKKAKDLEQNSGLLYAGTPQNFSFFLQN